MIEAAAAGRLNFSEASSLDSRWLLREGLILDALERSHLADLFKLRHNQRSAGACWPFSDTEGILYKEQMKEADELFDSVTAAVTPWVSTNKADHVKDEMASMRAEFVAKVGDPSSPELKRAARELDENTKRMQLETQRIADLKVAQHQTIQDKLAAYRKRRTKQRV